MIYEIEYWYFTGDEEKEFETGEIEADNFCEAVKILRLKSPVILGEPKLLSTKKPIK